MSLIHIDNEFATNLQVILKIVKSVGGRADGLSDKGCFFQIPANGVSECQRLLRAEGVTSKKVD